MNRWGTKYGTDLVLKDSLSGALVDHNTGHGEKTPMGSGCSVVVLRSAS